MILHTVFRRNRVHFFRRRTEEKKATSNVDGRRTRTDGTDDDGDGSKKKKTGIFLTMRRLATDGRTTDRYTSDEGDCSEVANSMCVALFFFLPTEI